MGICCQRWTRFHGVSWGDLWQLKRANLWQGHFPRENQLRDGFERLAPVDAFPPQNSFEIYDLLGNAWEWTLTRSV